MGHTRFGSFVKNVVHCRTFNGTNEFGGSCGGISGVGSAVRILLEQLAALEPLGVILRFDNSAFCGRQELYGDAESHELVGEFLSFACVVIIVDLVWKESISISLGISMVSWDDVCLLQIYSFGCRSSRTIEKKEWSHCGIYDDADADAWSSYLLLWMERHLPEWKFTRARILGPITNTKNDRTKWKKDVLGQQKWKPTTLNGKAKKDFLHTMRSSVRGIRMLVSLPGHMTNKTPLFWVSSSSAATDKRYRKILTCIVVDDVLYCIVLYCILVWYDMIDERRRPTTNQN